MQMRHDIDKLAKVVERKGEERTREEALADWLYGRGRDVRLAPAKVQTEFWCDACQRDFETTGVKQVQFAHGTGTVPFAYYVGKCPCGSFARRRITDKLDDPYFYKSEVIRKQQAQFSDDLLPPTHPRFKTVYPQQYAKLFMQEKGIILN